MSISTRTVIRTGAIAITLSAVAACTTAPVVAPPPPPPVAKAEPIPYRPLPPSGAAYAMDIPARGADGVRQTVNFGLDKDETTWHFRSGMNVAALNCQGPQDQPILDAYAAMLKDNSKALSASNAAIDKKYRANFKASRDAIKAREAHMTQVYNYFALPPARASFCGVARSIAEDQLATKPKDINTFAAANLPRLESAFEGFFQSYEQYVADSRAWDAKYGRQYGSSQPGYVAVYGAGGMPVETAAVAQEEGFKVADPITGANIPVTPAPEGEVATPVVQPVAKGDKR